MERQSIQASLTNLCESKSVLAFERSFAAYARRLAHSAPLTDAVTAGRFSIGFQGTEAAETYQIKSSFFKRKRLGSNCVFGMLYCE
jgi:hypothetical protein